MPPHSPNMEIDVPNPGISCGIWLKKTEIYKVNFKLGPELIVTGSLFNGLIINGFHWGLKKNIPGSSKYKIYAFSP